MPSPMKRGEVGLEDHQEAYPVKKLSQSSIPIWKRRNSGLSGQEKSKKGSPHVERNSRENSAENSPKTPKAP